MHIQDNAVELAGTMGSTAAVKQPTQWLLSETYWSKITNTKCFRFSYKRLLKKGNSIKCSWLWPTMTTAQEHLVANSMCTFIFSTVHVLSWIFQIGLLEKDFKHLDQIKKIDKKKRVYLCS